MLGVGFVLEKFSKNPILSVYLDDRLIDSFELSDCPVFDEPPRLDPLTFRPDDIYDLDHSYNDGIQEIYWNNIKKGIEEQKLELVEANLHRLGKRNRRKLLKIISSAENQQLVSWLRTNDSISHWIDYRTQGQKVPCSYKVYLIDHEQLQGKKEISIDVENSDSNYTNGFMNKSTLIDLRQMFLIPLEYLSIFKKTKEDFWKSARNIVPEKYNGLSEIWFSTNFAPAYPYAFTPTWNGQETDVAYLGGSGKLVNKLTAHNGIMMFDHNNYEMYLSKEIITWCRHKQKIEGTNEDLIYNGLNTNMHFSDAEVPAFHFSQIFFSLISKGLFDKYLK